MEEELNHIECIIIGAGAAGIAAARKLHDQGFPYLVLEARLRVGGRVYSELIDDIKLDLGACWIHSYTSKNPLCEYIQKFKIKQCKLSGLRYKGRVYFDGQEGKQFDEQIIDYAEYNIADYFRTAAHVSAHSETDLSINQAASNFYERKGMSMSDSEKRCTQLFINMTEHYEGSSTCQLSAKHFEYQQDSGGDYFPDGTYATLLKRIAQNLNIRLNKRVVCIEKTADKILIRCSDSTIYTCNKIIISLPLGVLKKKCVDFQPQLPANYQRVISSLGCAVMDKIVLSFQENFWGSVNWVSIGCNQRGKYSHFYNISQQDKHILCCFITDDFAVKIQHQTDTQIIQEVLRLLGNIYGQAKIKLREAKITRWASDEFSLGSYSSFHVGSTPEDCYEFRKPIQDRMYFVGQHCYAEHLGTAHGAFQTGIWAAQDILDKTQWINPLFLQPMHTLQK